MKKKSNKQFIKINNFISKVDCEKIIKEIDRFEKYDDLVMNGRKRINKGSKNFKNFINMSKTSSNFFKKINNLQFYNKIKSKILNQSKLQLWENEIKNPKFSKTVFGSQKGKRITKNKTNLKKNILYLDLDFSVSEKGYFRGPHRDRDSRVVNFLIYLNELKKVDGGMLHFYRTKKKNNYAYPRFPKKNEVSVSNKIISKRGAGTFFLSTPDSYHSVSRFHGKINKKRYFIYGSYSLNKPVKWFQNI